MKQPKDWKQLKRHQLSAEYPDLPAWQRDEMKAGVQKHGIVNRTVVLKDGEVLDGWQLHSVCVELDVKPNYIELDPEWDAAEFVEMQNNFRRHETEARVKERVAERRKRVADARAKGESTRQIAEKEGVSQATVNADIKANSGEQGCSPENANSNDSEGYATPKPPETVTGVDGKTYPAKQPKKLCPACQHRQSKGTPLIEKCEDCASLRKPKAEPKPEEKPCDENKVEWPSKAMPAVNQIPRLNSFRLGIVKLLGEVNGDKDEDGESKQNGLGHSPLSNHIDFVEIARALKQIRDNCISGAPKYVCPYCDGTGKAKGEKCKPCKGDAWVPTRIYKQAPTKEGAK